MDNVNTTPQSQRPQGSGFTNLQNILNANQNNKLGQAVGGGVVNAANTAKQNLQQTQQGFQQKTNQGSQDIKSGYQNVQNVLQDPTQASDADVANFAKYRSGQYGGPTDLGDVSKLQGQARTAEQLGQAGATEGGRVGLLQRFANTGPGYNAGQQKLDTMLLGQQANSNLAQARRTSFGLENKVNQAQQNAQQVGQGMQAKAQNLASDTNAAIQAQQNPMMSTLQQRATEQQAAKDAAAQRIQQGLQSGTLSAADAQQLGLEAGMNIGNIDLTQFFHADPTKANAQNVASAEEAGKLNALAKLGGQEQFGDVSKAGSFGQNQFGYDVNALKQDITNQQQAYKEGLSPIEQALQASQAKGQGILSNIFQNSSSGNNLLTNPMSMGMSGGLAGLGAATGQDYLARTLGQDIGGNINDPNAVNKLADYYAAHQGGADNYGKDFTQGQLGVMGGDQREALLAALSDIKNQQAQRSALQNQFGIGKTLNVSG